MSAIVLFPPSDILLKGVAQDIDDMDRAELEAATESVDMHEALINSRDASFECYVACIEGRPVAVFGLALYDPDGTIGIPWAVMSSEMRKYPRELMRVSRTIVARWRRMFPILENLVDARNNRAIRWLKRLGFEFGDTINLGGDTPFYKFEMSNV